MAQKLVAQDAFHDRITIIEPVDAGDVEAPVDVIVLRGVRQTLDAENELVELDPVGTGGIAGGRERL